MNALAKRTMNLYDQITYDASVDFADQHVLVSMLFRALADNLSDCERHMSKNEFTAKGEKISKAQNIITGLLTTLDFERGGKIATELGSIYRYCNSRLTQAHARNDLVMLREVKGILGKLESAWQSIPSNIANFAQ
jgi:flagellar protein FliS